MTPDDAPREVAAAARTDVGKVRSQNEDACLLRPDAGLFMAADGMGGHAAGDVASALAVETVEAEITGGGEARGRAAGAGASGGDAAGEDGSPDTGGDGDADGGALVAERGTSSGRARLPADGPWGDAGDAERAVREAVEEANRRIHRQARENPEQHGMGTTATVLLLPGRDRWVVAQVGDSRAYLLRGGELSRITTDHTVVPGSSTLTRALGTRADVQVDVLDGGLEPGDAFLLCSDGLTDMMAHDDIEALLVEALGGTGPGPAPDGASEGGGAGSDAGAGDGPGGGSTRPAVARAADALVEEVLERGAHDNVTAVVARVT